MADSPDPRLQGKVAVISGGAGGIGSALARRLVTEGARVAIGDLAVDDGMALANELGTEAIFRHLDVCDAGSWRELVAAAEHAFGGVSTLIHCAGVILLKSFEDTTPEDLRRQLEVNVIGVHLGTKSVIEPMKRAGGGAILVMSSRAAMQSSPHMVAYAASKAGSVSLTRTAAVELAPHGIRVNALVPGGIDTPMSRQVQLADADRDAHFKSLPIARIGVPEDITGVSVLLVSDESSYITGAVIPVDGGAGA